MRDEDFEAIELAWQTHDAVGLAEAAVRAGLALALDHLAPFEDSSFTRKAIVATIASALSHPAGIATCGVGGSWSHEVCLAVRHAGCLTIAIKPVARETVSPAGAWPELKPWFKDLAKNRARVEAWATREGEERVRIPLLRDTKREQQHDEDALLREIVANPDDPAARLVLADHLLEHEDVRGALIRFDLELANLPADDPHRVELERKSKRLVEDHGKRLAGLAGEVATEYRLAGGFVDEITIAAPAFKRHGDELLRTHPIRRVRIRPYTAAAVETLARSPNLARVRELELASSAKHVPLAPLHGFAFDALEALELRDLITLGTDGETFFARLAAPRFRKLEVIGGLFGARPLRGLASNCTSLVELAMANVRRAIGETRLEANAAALADEAFAALALPSLRTAVFNACWFATDARLADLVERAPSLASFAADAAGPRTYAQLARAHTLEELRIWSPLEQAQLEALLALPQLRALHVDNVPAADVPRIAETLLALPASHPLTSVWFAGPYHARLRARFPR